MTDDDGRLAELLARADFGMTGSGTLHDRLTARFSAIRDQADDTAVLAARLVDEVTEWLTSTEVAQAITAGGPRPGGVVVALVREALR